MNKFNLLSLLLLLSLSSLLFCMQYDGAGAGGYPGDYTNKPLEQLELQRSPKVISDELKLNQLPEELLEKILNHVYNLSIISKSCKSLNSITTPITKKRLLLIRPKLHEIISREIFNTYISLPETISLESIFDKNADIREIKKWLSKSKNKNFRNRILIQAATGHNSRLRNHETIKTLLLSGANIDKLDIDKSTPLLLAIESSYLDKIEKEEIVNILLDLDANVNASNRYKITPIKAAIKRGYAEIIKALLNKGTNVNTRDNCKSTPLLLAIECSNLNKNDKKEIVNILLNFGANVNSSNCYKTTPLNAAILRGYVDIIKTLLSKGANVNTRDNCKSTPLLLAIESSYLNKNDKKEIVKVLLDLNAKINVKDIDKTTPLKAAILRGCVEIVEILLSKGSNKDDCINIYFEYGEAFKDISPETDRFKRHEKIISILAETGANIPKYRGRCENTHLAKMLEEIYKKQLDRKKNQIINLLDDKIWSNNPENKETINNILHWTIENDFIDIVKQLLLLNPDINSYNEDGYTALMIAVEKGNIEIVNALLEKPNLIIDTPNDHGGAVFEFCSKDTPLDDTALSLAIEKGHIPIIKALLEKNANINLIPSYILKNKFVGDDEIEKTLNQARQARSLTSKSNNKAHSQEHEGAGGC